MRFAQMLLLGASLAAQEPGFVSLFNGKDLQGWTEMNRKGRGYVVENGLLVAPRDGGGNLYTAGEYSNFVFRFEFRREDGSNNGVGIRAPLEGDAAYAGMEIQVIDDSAARYKDIKPVQRHGSVYDVFPARTGFLKPVGEWNQEEITADGRRVIVVLNGTVITDVNLDDAKDPAVLKKHPGLARAAGHIGFLGHDTRVEFRNIRVKTLR
jgi:hypothetical protein